MAQDASKQSQQAHESTPAHESVAKPAEPPPPPSVSVPSRASKKSVTISRKSTLSQSAAARPFQTEARTSAPSEHGKPKASAAAAGSKKSILSQPEAHRESKAKPPDAQAAAPPPASAPSPAPAVQRKSVVLPVLPTATDQKEEAASSNEPYHHYYELPLENLSHFTFQEDYDVKSQLLRPSGFSRVVSASIANLIAAHTAKTGAQIQVRPSSAEFDPQFQVKRVLSIPGERILMTLRNLCEKIELLAVIPQLMSRLALGDMELEKVLGDKCTEALIQLLFIQMRWIEAQSGKRFRFLGKTIMQIQQRLETGVRGPSPLMKEFMKELARRESKTWLHEVGLREWSNYEFSGEDDEDEFEGEGGAETEATRSSPKQKQKKKVSGPVVPPPSADEFEGEEEAETETTGRAPKQKEVSPPAVPPPSAVGCEQENEEEETSEEEEEAEQEEEDISSSCYTASSDRSSDAGEGGSLTGGTCIPFTALAKLFNNPSDIYRGHYLQVAYRHVLSMLSANDTACKYIHHNMQPELSPAAKLFYTEIQVLQGLMYARLLLSPDEENARIHFLRQCWIREQRLLRLYETLRTEYGGLAREKENTMTKLNFTINQLIGEIDTIFQAAHQEINKISAEANKLDLMTSKAFDQELQQLDTTYQKAFKFATQLRFKYGDDEAIWRKKRLKLQAEVEALINRYDTEMGSRQGTVDEVSQQEKEQQEEIDALEKKLERLENRKALMLEEQRLAELEAKSKKKRKKGKKGKGRKGKKGRRRGRKGGKKGKKGAKAKGKTAKEKVEAKEKAEPKAKAKGARKGKGKAEVVGTEPAGTEENKGRKVKGKKGKGKGKAPPSETEAETSPAEETETEFEASEWEEGESDEEFIPEISSLVVFEKKRKRKKKGEKPGKVAGRKGKKPGKMARVEAEPRATTGPKKKEAKKDVGVRLSKVVARVKSRFNMKKPRSKKAKDVVIRISKVVARVQSRFNVKRKRKKKKPEVQAQDEREEEQFEDQEEMEEMEEEELPTSADAEVAPTKAVKKRGKKKGKQVAEAEAEGGDQTGAGGKRKKKKGKKKKKGRKKVKKPELPQTVQ